MENRTVRGIAGLSSLYSDRDPGRSPAHAAPIDALLVPAPYDGRYARVMGLAIKRTIRTNRLRKSDRVAYCSVIRTWSELEIIR